MVVWDKNLPPPVGNRVKQLVMGDEVVVILDVVMGLNGLGKVVGC